MTTTTTAFAAKPERARWGWTALLLAPSSFWFFMLLLLPLAVVIVYSLGVRAPTGGYQAAFTINKMKTSMQPVITPGAESGKVICQKVPKGEPPRSAEASSNLLSSFSRLT